MLTVKIIDVHYSNDMVQFVDKCQYGGVFFYSKQHGKDNIAKHTFITDFCLIKRSSEFVIQLENVSSYIYIIAHAGYSQVVFQAEVQARPCSSYRNKLYPIIQSGCNFLMFNIWPDMDFFIETGVVKGPVVVDLRLVNRIYNTNNPGVTLSSIDQDSFHLHLYHKTCLLYTSPSPRD